MLALKGNQETSNEDVRLFLDNPITPVAPATQASKGHDRVETRTVSISGDVAWLQGIYHWPTERRLEWSPPSVSKTARTSTESRRYLVGQLFPAERFNDIVRSHWGIENRLHWSLGVVFREDQARNCEAHTTENLAGWDSVRGRCKASSNRLAGSTASWPQR